MKRLVLMTAMAVIAVSFAAAAYCDDYYEGPPLKTIEGRVVSVDTLASKITVTEVNNITFYVGIDTSIKQDVFDIKLHDLKAGDYVTVEYRDDDSGRHNAVSIVKHYNEGEGV